MAEKKIKQKITKNILILEIAERYPKLVDVLVEKYGLHCLGCSMSAVETLEEGAMGHGMTKKEVEKMVANLNKLANKVTVAQKKK
jgi:hybrid cluster-associated redox disulfide protein